MWFFLLLPLNGDVSLHYATVKLGTPGMKFLVALDTGSDLFWVPCECTRCASIDGTSYASVSLFQLFFLTL